MTYVMILLLGGFSNFLLLGPLSGFLFLLNVFLYSLLEDHFERSWYPKSIIKLIMTAGVCGMIFGSVLSISILGGMLRGEGIHFESVNIAYLGAILFELIMLYAVSLEPTREEVRRMWYRPLISQQ